MKLLDMADEISSFIEENESRRKKNGAGSQHPGRRGAAWFQGIHLALGPS